MSYKELKNNVLNYLEIKLSDIGFKKSKYVYLYEKDKNSIFVIGLNDSKQQTKDRLFINPVMGLIVKPAEELLFKLTGYDSLKNKISTISRPLGYLMPENTYKIWEFGNNLDNPRIIDHLFNTILNYGIPFIEKCTNYQYIINEFTTGKVGLPFEKDYKIPILLFLNGQINEAFQYIEMNKKKNIEFYLPYNEFANNFKSLN